MVLGIQSRAFSVLGKQVTTEPDGASLFNFERRSHYVALAGLELITWPRMVTNPEVGLLGLMLCATVPGSTFCFETHS